LFSFVIAVSFALQNEVSETKRYIANQNEILEEMVEVRTHDLEKQTEFAVRASNTKSRFLATMSHEIRTPMNAIIGISEIQLAREDIAENTREAITKIHHSGQGLLAIINDILDLSKAESGKLEITPQTYEFASMINDTVLLNIGRIGSKPVTFTMEIAKGIPDKLIGDELRVKQILNNILSNAFKYTDSGNVQLIMTFERKADTVTLTITISDTGSGMREEEVKLLFDEYSRFNKFANRKTEGTGLGMNITGQLVKLMNGEIKVQSRFGKGSTFTVTLPQGLPEGAGELPEEIRERLCNFTYTEAGKHMKRRYEYMPYGKVLVVDDVDTNLYVAEGLMSPYGLKIKKAINGFEAVKFIEAGEEYDLIFMDHMMPEMDGVETVKRIREMGYTKPIAALTANALVGSEQFFAENGFDDFISKPIDVRDLDRILCRFVRDMNPEKAAMYKNRAKGNVHEQPSKKTDPKFAAVFVKDAKKAYRELEENSDNLEKIVIAAHSMKSACANIGETEVSKAAMILETAAREHDEVTVKELFDDFLLKLSEVIAKKEFESAKSKETAAESDIPAADPVEIAETFRALRMALDDYDEQTAEQILQKLLSMGLSESEREKVQAVSDMLFHSDFESAIDILG
jgi:signal transduction histidine kinase/CheY-like chemotaxis protein